MVACENIHHDDHVFTSLYQLRTTFPFQTSHILLSRSWSSLAFPKILKYVSSIFRPHIFQLSIHVSLLLQVTHLRKQKQISRQSCLQILTSDFNFRALAIHELFRHKNYFLDSLFSFTSTYKVLWQVHIQICSPFWMAWNKCSIYLKYSTMFF